MTLKPHNDELDRALQAATAGDVVVLPDGVSYTVGNWASSSGINVSAGVRIIGQGIDRSVIRLSPEAVRKAGGVTRPDRDLSVFWCGDGVEIEGCTIDGAEEQFRDPEWYVSGIRKHGNIVLRGVRITGLRGSWAAKDTLHKEIEVFALSGGGDVSRSRLENVVVDGCASSAYVSGLFLGGQPDQHGRGLVTGCTVDVGRDNQFAFSAQCGVTFRDCHGAGGRYGFYNDTGPTHDVDLLDCHLVGSWAGISLVSQRPDDIRRVLMRGGSVQSERLVEVAQKPGGAAECHVMVDGVRAEVKYAAAVDNSPPCEVRIQNCVMPKDVVRFCTLRSPEPVTRANWQPNGAMHQNQIKVLVS